MGYSDYTCAEKFFELSSTQGIDPSAMARRGLEGATGMVP